MTYQATKPLQQITYREKILSPLQLRDFREKGLTTTILSQHTAFRDEFAQGSTVSSPLLPVLALIREYLYEDKLKRTPFLYPVQPDPTKVQQLDHSICPRKWLPSICPQEVFHWNTFLAAIAL